MSQWKKARHCLTKHSRRPSPESARLESEGDDRLFFQLIYNEQHDPAQQWFDQHGWTAVATPLADYLRDVGRPVPGPDIEAGPMIARNTLVRAVKQ